MDLDDIVDAWIDHAITQHGDCRCPKAKHNK